MYEDKTLTCKDCGNEFVFTAGEQEFRSSPKMTDLFIAAIALQK